jgi:hypothetical protein
MFEAEGEYGEAEAEQEQQQEFLEILGELVAADGGRGGEQRSLDARTAREIALASELLEVQSEDELEEFLGKLLRRAGSAARGLIGSQAGKALRGILKDAAGKALPALGRAVGSRIGPDFGDAGEQVGRAAGSMLGLELEGLSHEDREFETARAFVRFADAATREAAAAERSARPAADVAQMAAATAAKEHLPGLLAGSGEGGGRWVRHGDRIVIHGA